MDREISNLLEQLDIHEDEDGEYVMLDDLNEVRFDELKMDGHLQALVL